MMDSKQKKNIDHFKKMFEAAFANVNRKDAVY